MASLWLRRRGQTPDLRAEAVGYVRLGWPVALGTWLVERGADGVLTRRPRHAQRPETECSCGQTDCRRPGIHPAAPGGVAGSRPPLAAGARPDERGVGPVTTDPIVVSYWWSKHREACIILPTGRSFDVLDVPIQAGWDALARLERAGIEVGPVASMNGRYHFFTQPSCRESTDPDGHLWRGLRWHAFGGWVAAVPSVPDSRWVREPDRSLPLPTAVAGTLLDTCDRVHAAWHVPVQRRAHVIAERGLAGVHRTRTVFVSTPLGWPSSAKV